MNTLATLRASFFPFIVATIFISVFFSCSEKQPETETTIFARQLLSEIECPDGNPMFGSFEFCADSYQIDEKITINMRLRKGHPLPLSRWADAGVLQQRLQGMVCDAVSRVLGITKENLFGPRMGIIQGVNIPGALWSDEYREQFLFDFAWRTRVKLRIPFKSHIYTVMLWAYSELNKVPRRCTVRKIRVEGDEAKTPETPSPGQAPSI